MDYISQLELLSHLLHSSAAEIQAEALALYIRHLEPQKRTALQAFLKAAGTDDDQGRGVGGGPGFVLAERAQRMELKLNTIKGRILNELRKMGRFGRGDFRTAVARAMRWDETRRAFGVESRFLDLAAADQGWWGTLKGKEKLIVSN